MFNDFSTLELILNQINKLLSIRLTKLPLDELFSLDRDTLSLHLIEFESNSVGVEFQSQVIHTSLLKEHCHGLNSEWKKTSLPRFCLNRSNFLFIKSSDLELNLKASTIFILDVSSAAETFELTFDHDTHLVAQSFCFFHRVSSQND